MYFGAPAAMRMPKTATAAPNPSPPGGSGLFSVAAATVGVPVLTPSWGNIIQQGYSSIVTAPALTVAPGIAIMLTVVSLNVLGDALRDALDPHARIRIRG